MKRMLICAGIVTLLTVALVGTAGAHGGLEGSSPEDGARVGKVPRRVTMTFSEVPSKDSVLKVIDGCRRDVVTGISVAENDLAGRIGAAQPGKWKASYRVISAEDGHLTKGTLRFTVQGEKDCNPNDGGTEPSDEPSEPGDGRAADPPGEDGSDFPVVPVAVGAAGLLIVGVVVRRVSAG